MFNFFGKKIQTKEQGWVKLARRQWPKWITEAFPRRESERRLFRGKTFDYRIETKIISGGIQGLHNGVEEISDMWRRLR